MNGLFWPGWVLFIVIWPIPSTRAETDPPFVEDSKTLEIPLQDYGESSTHCGLHALRAVANALDRPIPVDLLFCDGQFMSDAKSDYTREIPSDANVLLADCRMAVDYRSGHVPNAINIPSNSGFTRGFSSSKHFRKIGMLSCIARVRNATGRRSRDDGCSAWE